MLEPRQIKAAIAGVFIVLVVAGPTMLAAETLRVLRGDISTAIRVSVGGTVVVESNPPYSEISIANPSIADIASMPNSVFEVEGICAGLTTLTVFDYQGGLISNVEILVVPSLPEFDEASPVPLPRTARTETISFFNGVASHPLTIPASGSVILEGDVRISGIMVGDRGIADAALLDNSVYLLGKTVGTTTITLQLGDGPPAVVLKLNITPNINGSIGPACPTTDTNS